MESEEVSLLDIAFTNIDGITKYLASKMNGVNPSIIKLSIAISLKHFELVDSCLEGIATMLKIKPDILQGLFAIATCGFDS